MLYEYIKKHYQEAEPIFFGDLPCDGKPKSELSRQIRKLCEEEKLVKYDTGIYYMPKKTTLKNLVGPSSDTVAQSKYICKKGKMIGFYTGNTLANQFGISTQVSQCQEIISNNMSAKVMEIKIGGKKYLVRKSKLLVTNQNVKVLQLLELIKIIDDYMDEGYKEAGEIIKKYIRENHISKTDIDRYIRSFSIKVFKNYYELGIDDVFA